MEDQSGNPLGVRDNTRRRQRAVLDNRLLDEIHEVDTDEMFFRLYLSSTCEKPLVSGLLVDCKAFGHVIQFQERNIRCQTSHSDYDFAQLPRLASYIRKHSSTHITATTECC